MAITQVQTKGATLSVAASTLSATMNSTPIAGNYLILSVSSTQGVYVSSTGNIVWLMLQGLQNATGPTFAFTFVGFVQPSPSATVTITSVGSGGSQAMCFVVTEYSFTGGLLVPDQYITTATGNGTTPASGASGTTQFANELWIGTLSARSTNGTTYSAPTNSFAITDQQKTTINSANVDRSVAQLERIVSATGTSNPGATSSPTGQWCAQTLTFYEGSGLFGGAFGG